MSDPRVVKVVFSVTGEFEIHDHGDDYVNFGSKDDMKSYDRKFAKTHIERKIKNKGLEAFEYAISTKSRDMTEDDFPKIKEENQNNEPPF